MPRELKTMQAVLAMALPMSSRHGGDVILCADDFGISPAVNTAIERYHRAGALDQAIEIPGTERRVEIEAELFAVCDRHLVDGDAADVDASPHGIQQTLCCARRLGLGAQIGQEDEELAKLRELKMNIIGPADGLQIDAFRASVGKVVQEKFGSKFGDLYRDIAAIR